MEKFISITMLLFMAWITFGQEVTHYEMSVDFDVPRRSISVKGTLTVDFRNRDSIGFVLWKNTVMKGIKIDGRTVEYSFDTTGKSPNQYIPNGGRLTIQNPQNTTSKKKVQFKYSCDMKKISGWAKSYSEEWIELGYYTAWYPIHEESKRFTSTIRISIDDGFGVSGSGLIKQDGNDWIITHDWPVFDNVIIAARDLKTKIIGSNDVSVELVYTKFPEKDLVPFADTCRDVYTYFSGIFGMKQTAYLKYVLNPLEGRGGYSRSKFVSMKISEFSRNLTGGIAHEMAHFWWNKADTSTWEDWLNESFAETSKLLYLREGGGEEMFDRLVKNYTEKSRKTPPVWGIERDSDDAYTALYKKGPLILLDFEKKLGTEKFYKFLRTMLSKNIITTADLLNLIETEFSKELRIWFENKLKT